MCSSSARTFGAAPVAAHQPLEPDVLDSLLARPETALEWFEQTETPDSFGTDYEAVLRVCAALVEDPASPVLIHAADHVRYRAAADYDLTDETSTLARATGAGFEHEDCELFSLTAAQVRDLCEQLAREPWFAELFAFDDDRNIPGLLRFYAAAARAGKAVVGYVNV